jgi:hypothetical protein
MEQPKKKLREYAVLNYEVYVLDFIEKVTDYINNDFLREGLSWNTIVFCRILPWMVGNVVFAHCTLPIMLWLVKFLFSIHKYIDIFC